MILFNTPLPYLEVLCTALEQFIDNQPDLDPDEQESPEVPLARELLDIATDAMHDRLTTR